MSNFWLKQIRNIYFSADTLNRSEILGLLEENRAANVLESGCSDGALLITAGKRIKTSKLWGIDISTALQSAEKMGIKVLDVDLNNQLPIPDESFNVVIANQVMEHIFETDIFLKETHRILKKGGYAIISVPNLASLHNISILLLGWQPLMNDVSSEVYVGNIYPRNKTLRGQKKLGHIRLFTKRALHGLLEYHGFKVEKMMGVGYYPFPKRIAHLLSKLDKSHAVYLTAKVRK